MLGESESGSRHNQSYEVLAAHVERAKHNPAFLPTVLTKDFNIRETAAGAWLTFSR